MSYTRWFNSHWGDRTTGTAQVRCYLTAPEALDTAARIASYDKSAAEAIEAAQRMIDDLREYRQALAARYAALETMPYRRKLTLFREKSFTSGKVFYFVAIRRIMQDGTKTDELHERYTGTERHKAIARYKALQKQYPGIDCEMDIEKSRWEK